MSNTTTRTETVEFRINSRVTAIYTGDLSASAVIAAETDTGDALDFYQDSIGIIIVNPIGDVGETMMVVLTIEQEAR